MRKRQPSAKASGSETDAAMDPHPDDQTQTARKDPLRAARFEDAIVGVVAIAAAGLLYWATFYFHAVDWTPLGLAFWPRVLLAGLVLASLALMVLRQLDVHPRLHINRAEITLFAAIAGFVIALPILGFLLTGFAYTLGTILWLDADSRLGWIRATLLAFAATAATYAVFGLGLNVWLPSGLPGDWLGF
jgi:hypothetical protein